MRSRQASAYAPGAISNFFSIHTESLEGGKHDYSKAGATGGGYILSRGVRSVAKVTGDSGAGRVRVVVDGDPTRPRATTTAALKLFTADLGVGFEELFVEQRMEIPVGYGFGSSAASSISAVLAAAAALGIHETRERLASYAHRADIDLGTGLGTVSASYRATGAGLIATPGGPGVAAFINVDFPEGLRLVTASVAPYSKPDALGSAVVRRLVNSLGEAALRAVLRDPTLESLASEGEKFANGLGLMSPETRSLLAVAKSEGAMHASQNMIGQAVHAVVEESKADRVASAFRAANPSARVDILGVASEQAGVTSS